MIRNLCPPLLWLLLLVPLYAEDLTPQAPSAVLLDQLTGRVLFQKQPDLSIPPASLTKLMTLHLAWKALAEGRVEPDTEVPITSETTGAAVPPGSSLMFLEPGQRVTFRDLMLGLAVDSGNDAGLTLARYLGGAQAAFVAAMNAETQTLGLTATQFYDSYGYDARNRTTAADFARFSRYYLATHPQAVQVLHNVREWAFPLALHRAPGDKRPVRTIVQANRNTLLGLYPGADGLKTGFIDESGYNLAATAQRGGQRLVVVLLGVKGRDAEEGGRLRTAAAIRLFDWGFERYPLRALPLPELGPLRVWYADAATVVSAPQGPTVYPLSDQEASAIQVRREGPTEVVGPLPQGTVVGKIVWSQEGRDFYSISLATTQTAGPAPWWTAVWDALVLFFRGMTGTPAPVSLSPASPRR